MNHTSDACPSRDLKSHLNDGGYGPPPHQPYQRWNPRINQGNLPTHASDYSSIRDLVFSQAQINEEIHSKLLDHDKIYEDIHARLNSFSLSLRNQLIFNKKLENQLATLISKISHEHEKVNAITTRGCKITHDPPYPKAPKKKVVVEVQVEEKAPVVHQEKKRTTPHEFYDTEVLPFPERNRKATEDE